jgi:hypothetical protein
MLLWPWLEWTCLSLRNCPSVSEGTDVSVCVKRSPHLLCHRLSTRRAENPALGEVRDAWQHPGLWEPFCYVS